MLLGKSQIPLRYPASEPVRQLAGLRPARYQVADLLASCNLAYHALSSSLAALRPGLRPG